MVESPSDPSLWYVVSSAASGKIDLVLCRHTTSSIDRTIPLPDYTGSNPASGVRVNADETKVNVGVPGGVSSSGELLGAVVSVDLASGQVRSVPGAGGLSTLELSLDSRRPFAGAGHPKVKTDLISVIDTASDTVVGKISVPSTIYGWPLYQTNRIKVDVLDPNRLWVTSTDGNALCTVALDASRVADVKVFNREELQPHWLPTPSPTGSAFVLLTKTDRSVTFDMTRPAMMGAVAFPAIDPNAYRYEVAREASGNLLTGQNNGLLEVDPGTMRLVSKRSLPPGSPQIGVFSLSRDGRQLYAVTQAWGAAPGDQDNPFVAVDRPTTQVAASIPLEGGKFNWRPFVHTDARKVYVVGGRGSDSPTPAVVIHVVDEDGLAIRKTITYDEKGHAEISTPPYFPFAYDADSRTLWVGSSCVVLAIDTTTDTISKVIRLNGSAGAIGLRTLQLQSVNAVGLVWHTGRKLLFIAHLDRSYVSVYDPANDRFLPGLFVLKGFFPNQLLLSPDGSRLFAVNRRSDSLSVIDLATGSVQELDLHEKLPHLEACGLACAAVAPSEAAVGKASAFGATVTTSRSG